MTILFSAYLRLGNSQISLRSLAWEDREMQTGKRLALRLGALLLTVTPLADPLVRGPPGTWQDVRPGLGLLSLSVSSARACGLETVPGAQSPCPSAWLFPVHIPCVISSEPHPRPEAELWSGMGWVGAGEQQFDLTHRGLDTGLPIGWGLVPLGNGKEGVVHCWGRREMPVDLGDH